MAYAPTNWVDGVTPVNAANLNHLEQGLNLAALQTDSVPKDGAVSAVTRILINKLLAGDAQPAFRVMGDGKMDWGAGGAGAVDTALYRLQPGSLKTSGDFYAGGGVVVDHGNVGQKLYFGAALDTNLYRSAAGELKTDSHLEAGGQIHSMHGSTGKIILSTDNGAPTGKPLIYFGSDLALSLYRLSATQLASNGTIVSFISDGSPGFAHYNTGLSGWLLFSKVTSEANARFYIRPTGELDWGPGSTGVDTNLYRYGAGFLRTDGVFQAGGNLVANVGLATQVLVGGASLPQIVFGSAADTNLYRSGAGALKTDGGLQVGGSTGATSGQALEMAYSNLGAGVGFGGTLFAYDRTAGAVQPLYINHPGGNTSFGFVNAVPPQALVHLMPGGAPTTPGQGIKFGTDTTIYRSAVGTLRLDGTFICQNFGMTIVAAAVPGTQNKRFPVYDQATGALAGWVPLYN